MATPEEKYQCVSWFIETHSHTQVQKNFRAKYEREPPSRKSIGRWHKKFVITGSIQPEKRSGSNKKVFIRKRPDKATSSDHTLEVKEQCVSWFKETQSVTQVQRNFRTKYKKQAPSQKSIRAWTRKFIETGNFLNKKSSGRPKMSEEDVERIHKVFLENPTISIRSAAKLLNLSNSTVHKMLQTRILPSKQSSDNSATNSENTDSASLGKIFTAE